MTALTPSSRDHGFSLIEVLIATLLFASVALAGTWALSSAAILVVRAREETVATAAANERLEQLRGLEWGNGDAAAPAAASDSRTDLSGRTAASGGAGLTAGSSSTLQANQPPYVDHLDRLGQWVGNGPLAPAAARFTRRWSVSAPGGAPDARLLQVVVSRATAVGPPRSGDVVWLADIKSRMAF